MATKIGRKDPRPVLCIDGVKGLPRVSWGQQETNLLKMPYGYQWSTRGQLKCVGPSNVANATEHYAAAGALVSTKIVNQKAFQFELSTKINYVQVLWVFN